MERYDIILQAGQSNADGTGRGPVEQPYIPSADILYLQAAKTVQITAEGISVTYADQPFLVEVAEDTEREDGIKGDFSLTFARDYIDHGLLAEGRKLLIIRAAVGGTGFKRKNWGLQDQLYLKMLEMADYALSCNPENRLVAFLWHQGEHDAVHGTPPDMYKSLMRDLVYSVRARYGNDKLPFLAGDFVQQWKQDNAAISIPIAAKLQELCNEIGSAAFVETKGLPSNDEKTGNGDSIHFCRQSLYDLGHRYFNAFQSIGNKDVPAL